MRFLRFTPFFSIHRGPNTARNVWISFSLVQCAFFCKVTTICKEEKSVNCFFLLLFLFHSLDIKSTFKFISFLHLSIYYKISFFLVSSSLLYFFLLCFFYNMPSHHSVVFYGKEHQPRQKLQVFINHSKET